MVASGEGWRYCRKGLLSDLCRSHGGESRSQYFGQTRAHRTMRCGSSYSAEPRPTFLKRRSRLWPKEPAVDHSSIHPRLCYFRGTVRDRLKPKQMRTVRNRSWCLNGRQLREREAPGDALSVKKETTRRTRPCRPRWQNLTDTEPPGAQRQNRFELDSGRHREESLPRFLLLSGSARAKRVERSRAAT
jgi:hypothetical protein